jgi:hypothetical protein
MIKQLCVICWIAVCSLGLTQGQTKPVSEKPSSESSIPALRKYKVLNDFFPYGFWFPDACACVSYCRAMNEDYGLRLGKILQDFSRHYINTVLPSNREVTLDYLNTMTYYGQRCIAPRNLLIHALPLKNGAPDRRANLDAKQLKEVETQWAEHIAKVKDHPALLAWHVFDEPHPDLSPTIHKLVQFMEKEDPAHPVLYTHQNLPLGSWPSEWDLLKSLDVNLSDCYSLPEDFGVDPWLYGDVAIAEFRRANPQAVCWPIIQAFDYGKMPTVGELRVMVYHTIGCGAKGMFFFTPEQVGMTWDVPGIANPTYKGIGNAWFAEDFLLTEIGRIGYNLASAGPLLVDLQYRPNYAHHVETKTFTVKIDAKRIKLRKEISVTKPTIHVGAFVGRDFDVLVIHNDDRNLSGEGTISIPVRGKKAKVYDLYDLTPVATSTVKNQIQFQVGFEPGDGKLYLVGDDAAFSQARQTVLRHRYDQQVVLVKLDVDLARKAKVDVKASEVLQAQAAAQAQKNEFSEALNTLTASREKLVEAENKLPDYSKVKKLLESLRAEFTSIDDHFKSLDVKKIPAPWKETMIALTQRFSSLENEFRAGKPNVSEADALSIALAAFTESVFDAKPQP